MAFQQKSNPYDQDREGGKTAATICYILTAIAIITLIIGILLKNPYWVIAGIVPAALYEAWRTEGYYTKIASVIIAALSVLEIFAILGTIKFNLAELAGQDYAYVAGESIPLGDIRFVFPIIAVILSIALVRRTYGKYTKWLSILLVASSIALLFLVNKNALGEILRLQLY